MRKSPLFVLFVVGLAACGDACDGGSDPSSVPQVDTSSAATNAGPGASARIRPRIHVAPPPADQEGGAPAPSAVP